MLRPTGILDFTLDPAITDEETVIEIRRTFSYVAPMRINDGETPEPPYEPANTIGLIVKLVNHPYWKSVDQDADSIWSDVLAPWLHNKLIKIQNTVSAVNKNKREKGIDELHYAFLKLEMGAYSLTFENTNDEFSPEVEPCLQQFREFINTGILKDKDVASVMIPWQDPEVIQARYDAKLAAEKAEAERAAAEAAAAEGADAKGTDAGEAVPQAGEAAPATAEADAAEAGEEESFESANFQVWEVTFQDGSTMLLDSDTGEAYVKPEAE